MSSKKMFPEISKSIREREEHSKNVLRKCIRESKGDDRSYAWRDKRSYGWETRHTLLMYAMVRGRSYAACEKKCHDAPSAYHITVMAEKFGFKLAGADVDLWIGGQEFPPAKKAPPEPEEVEATPAPAEPGFFAGLKSLLWGSP